VVALGSWLAVAAVLWLAEEFFQLQPRRRVQRPARLWAQRLDT
jgi:hypothetical protein